MKNLEGHSVIFVNSLFGGYVADMLFSAIAFNPFIFCICFNFHVAMVSLS